MTDEIKQPDSPGQPTPQTQKQRWIKYGANVALSSIVVIALATLLTYMAQVHAQRIDTTIGGSQSLRPQTLNYIKDLQQKVRLIALYPKLKAESREQDFYQPVVDLLNDYAGKGKNISAEFLDPDTQKDDFNKLVTDVTNRFGGEVKGYQAVLDSLPAQNDIITKFANDEVAQFKNLPGDQVKDQNLQQAIFIAYPTLVSIPRELANLKDGVDTDLAQQIPSYKDGVEATRKVYSNISQELDLFNALLESIKNTPNVPREFADYVPGAQARATAAKKVAAAMLDQIQHLGQLKELDEFREQLRSKSILVLTDNGYRILQFDQVWKMPQSSRFAEAGPDVQPKLAFAGEQQITSAIVTLTIPKKPMVVFVRISGPPLTTVSGGAAAQEPLFAAVARRLKEYNFEVREKDASGQSAMMGTDPTDAEMKDAVWVVVRSPHDDDDNQVPLDQMLAKHLQEGGSAMVLTFPLANPMDAALNPIGVHVTTAGVVVHELLPPAPRRTTDMVDAALQSSQLFFKINDYGDSPITQPLQGLDFVNAACAPVQIDSRPPPGATITPLLPFPQTPHSWAVANAASALTSEEPPKITFNPAVDLDNTPDHPLYGAAAVEKADGGRVVAVGSYWFATPDPVDLPDIDMLEKHGLTVARLPGNGEFFVNSIFWLSHMDAMLAISPHALQVARIDEMSPKTLAFWRVGVLTAGLPAAVVVAGMLVYARRRD
jgi:hypothetical protein